MSSACDAPNPPLLAKTPTGIAGLDDVLCGGLPAGRPTLICGAAGCGKTLLSMQFLVRGVLDYGEPGAFVAFEEREEDLRVNVASLGFDLADLQARKLISIDHIQVDPSMIVESGDYDLSGLFFRLQLAIDTVGAKRVVIDTLETLFGGLSNSGIVRAELRRLFEWLKDRNVTAVITAERGDNVLTRHGLEEYVSDCVLLLDHRVTEQVSTRRMRVVKYRGSVHSADEHPFLIDENGLSVLPITSAGLDHQVSDERVRTGVTRLDTMLGGQGYYRGSTVLLSGLAGTGKTSLAAHFARATCEAGERALYFSFEESPEQIIRNMQAIGIDLRTLIDRQQLRFVACRATTHGIETHLALIHKQIRDFKPSSVIVDPVSNFVNAGSKLAARGLVIRLVDFLKGHGITALMLNLSHNGEAPEATETEMSSIVDTWLLLKTIELSGERNRVLYVLKSRGMAHSNQIREFVITNRGVDLVDVYVGTEGVLTGSARAAQGLKEETQYRQRQQLLARKQRRLQQLQALHRERLAQLQASFENEIGDLNMEIEEGNEEMRQYLRAREVMGQHRGQETDRSAADDSREST